MSHLDKANEFHVSRDSATEEMVGCLKVFRRADGKVEVWAEESTKKWDGKKWHSRFVCLTLNADQVTKLREAL